MTVLPPQIHSQDPHWSPTSGYNDSPYGHATGGLSAGPGPMHHNPQLSNGMIDSPPVSGHNSGASATDMNAGPNMSRRNNSHGNPSPPSSITGSVAGSMSSERRQYIEEMLAEHYRCLKLFLQQYLQEQALEPRQARARDKLVRLTSIQFQELSTDVYDELLRRDEEDKRGGPQNPDNDVPRHLLPKPNFHFKRNQARQKLATLPHERFRQLATDVFFELERRFPRFHGGERSASRAGSLAGSVASGISGFGPPSRTRTPNGLPPRGDSRGPPMRNGPGDVMGEYGRPMPKTYHSDTIVPNKGMMVEDDDDSSAGDELMHMSSADGAEYQSQIAALEQKVGQLENDLARKDAEHETARSKQSTSHDTDRSEWTSLRASLDKKVQDAETLNRSLQTELERIRQENSQTERDLRSQVDKLQNSGRDAERELHAQLDVSRQQAIEMERSLRDQLEEARHLHQQQASVQSRSMDSDDSAHLRQALDEQQRITDEVRREGERFLQDMRSMAQQTAEALEKEEALLMQVEQLQREVKEWKDRHAKAKTQARSIRASAHGLPNQQSDPRAQFSQFMNPRGLVKDFHVTNFQLGINELLQLARQNDADGLMLDCTKEILVNLRSITADANLQSPTPSAMSEDGQTDSLKDAQRTKLRLSQAANNLINATKTHIAARGIAPTSLLDAAATNLTLALVELIKSVGIRPSSPEELDYDSVQRDSDSFVRPALPARSNGIHHTYPESQVSGVNGSANLTVDRANTDNHARNSSISSNAYSNYSHYSRYSQSVNSEAIPPPPPPKGLGLGITSNPSPSSDTMPANHPIPRLNLQDWRDYLEDATSMLIQFIQPMINTLRAEPQTPTSDATVHEYILDIDRIVADVCSKSDASVKVAGVDIGGLAVQKHIPSVIEVLDECRSQLLKENLPRDQAPPVAFKIARATKELTSRIDRIKEGKLTAQMILANDI